MLVDLRQVEILVTDAKQLYIFTLFLKKKKKNEGKYPKYLPVYHELSLVLLLAETLSLKLNTSVDLQIVGKRHNRPLHTT